MTDIKDLWQSSQTQFQLSVEEGIKSLEHAKTPLIFLKSLLDLKIAVHRIKGIAGISPNPEDKTWLIQFEVLLSELCVCPSPLDSQQEFIDYIKKVFYQKESVNYSQPSKPSVQEIRSRYPDLFQLLPWSIDLFQRVDLIKLNFLRIALAEGHSLHWASYEIPLETLPNLKEFAHLPEGVTLIDLWPRIDQETVTVRLVLTSQSKNPALLLKPLTPAGTRFQSAQR